MLPYILFPYYKNVLKKFTFTISPIHTAYMHLNFLDQKCIRCCSVLFHTQRAEQEGGVDRKLFCWGRLVSYIHAAFLV